MLAQLFVVPPGMTLVDGRSEVGLLSAATTAAAAAAVESHVSCAESAPAFDAVAFHADDSSVAIDVLAPSTV